MKKSFMRRLSMSMAALLLCGLFATNKGYAQTYTVLFNFNFKTGNPMEPGAPLAQGVDGTLYGTSWFGGANGTGAVYKYTPGGTVRTLDSFCSQATCGFSSYTPSSLTLRLDEHFIGTKAGGGTGTNRGGTIYDVSPTGTETVLYNFNGGTESGGPATPPIEGADGQFYGTTTAGGPASGVAPQGCGTAYRFTGAGFTLLHDFNGPVDGCTPNNLVLGADGNLYGTTLFDGPTGFGTLFKMTPNGNLTVLHGFNGTSEGAEPSDLILGNDGNFYGTLQAGLSNAQSQSGAIYKITPGGAITVLHTFDDNDGNCPTGLVQASDGNFYGAASGGGPNQIPCSGAGNLFEITSGGDFNVLYAFTNGSDGIAPFTPMQHTNGVLYGVTREGGVTNNQECPGCGVLFSLNNNLPPFAALAPYEAKVGASVQILGQGFTSSSTVSFNGMPATTVSVSSATRLVATVPGGATNGPVTVTTSSGTLTSSQTFIVAP